MSVSVFNGDVLALDIAEIVESLPERRDIWLGRGLRFYGDQDTNPLDFPRLLRLGRERRVEKAEGHTGNKASPVHYSIT